MKNVSLKSVTIGTLLVLATVLITYTVLAQESPTPESQPYPQAFTLFEWNGEELTSRSIQVFSAEEKVEMEQWNASMQTHAEWVQQHGSQKSSGEEPSARTIETKHGPVTIEQTVNESDVDISNLEPREVEVESIDTPYGSVTIEKQSFD